MRYLKIICKNSVDANIEVVKWNSWDGEHLASVHKAYSNPQALYVNRNIGLSIDSFSVPYIPIKFKTMFFTVQDSNTTQLSYAKNIFFLAKNTISLKKISDKKTVVEVTYEFELNFFMNLFRNLITRYITKWNEIVWKEDLPLKLRRQRALEYGFIDWIGLPMKIKNRKDRSNVFKADTPVKYPMDSGLNDHNFFKKGNNLDI